MFKLHKYPVTSAEGNEYSIDVDGNERYLHIYVNVKIKSWFGEKFKCVYDDVYYSNMLLGPTYKEMAVQAVKAYENRLGRQRLIQQRIAEFNQWDGKCK